MKHMTEVKDAASVLPILSQISIFGGVTDAQFGEIFHRLKTAAFQKGEFIFQKGEEPSHFYIVKSGAVSLQIMNDRIVVNKKTLGVGELFGHVALISMQKHKLSAVAMEDMEALVLSRRALIDLRHEDVELFALLMLNIARELARRLTFTDDLLLESTLTREERRAYLAPQDSFHDSI